MRKEYSIEALEDLIIRYGDACGMVYEVGDNGVGLGTVILYNQGIENLSNFVIKEKYLNEWCSTHTLTRYKKLPEKYLKIIDKLEMEETQDEKNY